jgi:hypothetical protein
VLQVIALITVVGLSARVYTPSVQRPRHSRRHISLPPSEP